MDVLHARPAAKLQPIANVVGVKPRKADLRFLHGQPFQLSIAHSARRIPGRPCLQQLQAAQHDLNSSNTFRVRHSISSNSFEVKGDIKKIFQYAADFSHISRWDSGTTGSELRESNSRPALRVGDTVALMTVLFGVKSSTVYQLLEKDSPNKVVFFGNSRFHESTDTVTFRQKPGAKDVVIVDYHTDIELVRWYKWFQPLLGFVMANLAKEAVEGLQAKLQQLQEQGKIAPEQATAGAR